MICHNLYYAASAIWLTKTIAAEASTGVRGVRNASRLGEMMRWVTTLCYISMPKRGVLAISTEFPGWRVGPTKAKWNPPIAENEGQETRIQGLNDDDA